MTGLSYSAIGLDSSNSYLGVLTLSSSSLLLFIFICCYSSIILLIYSTCSYILLSLYLLSPSSFSLCYSCTMWFNLGLRRGLVLLSLTPWTIPSPSSSLSEGIINSASAPFFSHFLSILLGMRISLFILSILVFY
jgi:hypothetical protein